jgi:hypothetical protein
MCKEIDPRDCEHGWADTEDEEELTDDPSPYCQYCGAMKKSSCTCGPTADND